jgi:hypothetical protein
VIRNVRNLYTFKTVLHPDPAFKREAAEPSTVKLHLLLAYVLGCKRVGMISLIRPHLLLHIISN